MTTKEDWIVAGRITAQAREFSRELIKPGVKLIDAAEKIEAKIIELGGELAFPVNISLNHIAAHYTPIPGDELVFSDQVVKVDIGVCVNGAIGDSAYTVDLSGKYSALVDASYQALEEVKKILKAGVTIGEIGKTIQDTITKLGFSPVKNLCGHALGPYALHAGQQFPNYDTGDKTVIEPGMIFAIEPFATDGRGLVQESGEAIIYSQTGNRPVRDPAARKLLQKIDGFTGLPFATRHVVSEVEGPRLRLAIRSLKLAGNVDDYPPLAEVSGGMVSQAEDSFMIDEDGKAIVLTKL